MDTHTLQLLELEQIKTIVASHAICEMGRRRVMALPVLTSSDTLEPEYLKVDEMIKIISSIGDIPTEGMTDVQPLIDRIAIVNSYLEPAACMQLFNFLSAVTNILSFFDDCKETHPKLYELTRGLIPLPSYKQIYRQIFNVEGEVKDDASDALKEIRHRKNDLSKRIDGTLEKYLYDPSKRVFLQDLFITERNYRKVLPVRVECKHQIRGIIHAYSITEETAFIEPMEVVEMSNELTDIIVEEEKEIKRILIEIGNHLREKMDALKRNAEIVSEIDSLRARAIYARKRNCHLPKINDTGNLKIDEGRHPLLMESLGKRCVPISLSLNQKNRALIISGPNAGGKTTAVKTIGILALLAQSAIPIPANPSSSFPLFADFFADIGDEQSLAQGISTFSSHIKQIKVILEKAPEHSLVILDELGTATDPSEGSLLAQAILEELAQRSAMTLVTSHLTALKTLDRTKEWARTASFSLDPKTEMPNFILSMDVPGESNALKVARILGLPKFIIDRAYQLMSPDERQLKTIIEQVKAERNEMEKLRKEAEKEHVNAAKSRERYYKLIDELEIEKSKIKEARLALKKEINQEKKRLLIEARKKIEKLIADLPSREEILKARTEITGQQKEIDREAAEIEKEALKIERKEGRPAKPADMKSGAIVYVETLQSKGIVKRYYDNSETADITVDNLDFNVALKNIRIMEGESPAESVAEIHTRQISPIQRISTTEINLIGKTVEVALELLDKFIDDALLSGFDRIRIVHGYGTGTLRQAVRSHLKGHPMVKSYRQGTEEEGQNAVTIAEL